METKKVLDLVKNAEDALKDEFKKVDEIAYLKTSAVLSAFNKENIVESDFASTTGYGYGDEGRSKIEKVFADVLGFPDAIVRNQFVSASHALTVTFFALLRPGDTLLSVSGKPYDTMDDVIGFNDNPSSLKSFNIKYDQIDLKDNDFDYDKISSYLKKHKVKVIEIQRSRGYSTRDTLSIDKVKKVCKFIKDIDKDIIIMVDNCYCEFTEKEEIGVSGCDIAVGSLIKNLGGGIAPNGAYVAGRHDLINLVGERLTLPGEGRDVGPTLSINRSLLMGIYMAPNAVKASIKVSMLTSYIFESLGYKTSPRYDDVHSDIVLAIYFNDKDKLIKYVQGIQKGSAIDSNTLVVPGDMPGYTDKIIMASGSFTQGSSIEVSCDGPIREPFIAYQQGSMYYEAGRYAVIKALENLDI